jgi:hypothetical protein
VPVVSDGERKAEPWTPLSRVEKVLLVGILALLVWRACLPGELFVRPYKLHYTPRHWRVGRYMESCGHDIIEIIFVGPVQVAFLRPRRPGE